MKNFVIIFSLLITICIINSSYAEACQNAPELKNIDNLLQKVDNGETLGNVEITPRLFLSLDTSTRQKLSGALKLCDKSGAKIALNNGVPIQKVSADFYDLYTALYQSALETDEATSTLIKTAFTAAPISAKEAFLLIERTGLSPGVARAVADSIGLELHRPDPHKKEICDHLKQGDRLELSMIEIFSELGGRINEKDQHIFVGVSNTKRYGYVREYWWVNTGDTKEPIHQIYANNRKCHIIDFHKIVPALKQVGFNVEIGREMRDKYKPEYKEKVLGSSKQSSNNDSFFD